MDDFKEADNCLNCTNKPCQKACPLDNDIPVFINHIKEKEYRKAFDTLLQTTVLPRICGRVCRQCQTNCTKKKISKAVEIGNLESKLGDYAQNKNWKIDCPKETKYNVAIIGSGPAGLTCAAFLRRNGIGVTIYEKYDYLGGLLKHGIPNFRLKEEIVDETVDDIIKLGIAVRYKMELGNNIDIETIKEKHDAVFIGIGANVSNKMNIEGENLNNVYGANEIIEKDIDIKCDNKTVAVIGGGDVAIDVARIIQRKNPKKVMIIYRRSSKEMTANEVDKAIEENIEIIYNTNIIKIIGTEKVEKIELIKTEVIESKVSNIKGSNYDIPCDIVIMAIGSHQDKTIDSIKIEKTENGKIKIDSKGHTSDEKIFAGGDITETIQKVSNASKTGREAAYSIIEYLKKSSEEDFIEPLFDYE